MTNEMTHDDFQIQVSNLDEEALKKLTEKSFLPYIKLIGTSSEEGKNAKADNYIEPGSWAVFDGKDQATTLGEQFEALTLATRPKACMKTDTGVRSFFDEKSDEYKQIKHISDTVKGKTGKWYGPEILTWIRPLRMWATFHASNKTARSRAADIISSLISWGKAVNAKGQAIKDAGNDEEKLATAKAIVVKNPQFTFKCNLTHYSASDNDQWAPVFTPATTPFSELPDWQDMKDKIKAFIDPPKTNAPQQVTPGADAAPPNERG